VTPGNGLRGMRERIEGEGGDLAITTEPGKGFSVQARLPRGRRAPRAPDPGREAP
jgi:signal transduction histidine kinase